MDFLFPVDTFFQMAERTITLFVGYLPAYSDNAANRLHGLHQAG